MTKDEFSQHLRETGVTLEQFARITGIKQRTLTSYVYGERRIPRWMNFMFIGVQLYLKLRREDK